MVPQAGAATNTPITQLIPRSTQTLLSIQSDYFTSSFDLGKATGVKVSRSTFAAINMKVWVVASLTRPQAGTYRLPGTHWQVELSQSSRCCCSAGISQQTSTVPQVLSCQCSLDRPGPSSWQINDFFIWSFRSIWKVRKCSATNISCYTILIILQPLSNYDNIKCHATGHVVLSCQCVGTL